MARRLPESSRDVEGKARLIAVVVELPGDLPADKLVVVMEAGGRVRIPTELYERIGSGPGGLVQMRRCGRSVVIERLS